MPDEEFGAVVRVIEKGPVIDLVGTVNRAAKEKVDTSYAEATRTPGEILLDFTRVDYINSTGIAVIVGVLAKARSEGRVVGAVGLSEHYKEVFEITRLADFMHIYSQAIAGN